MPWVALAPRACPTPRPRLRLVKAAPKPPDYNPYKGLTEAQLWNVHSGLQQALLKPLAPESIPKYQEELQLLEQQMVAQGLLQPPVHSGTGQPLPTAPAPIDSVQQWETLMDLAQAAAPKMQQALTDAFDWPKLPSGVQQSLVQGQVAQALAQMADFGMQQMEASYVPAFSELAETLFTDVAAAQWPALRQTLLATDIPFELPTKLPDDLMVQRALRYVRQEGFTRAKNLWIPTIEASREIIRVGLAEGKTTPTIARELRQHIGLLPGQGKQLMAYNQGLMESGTPPAKVDALTEKFAAKLLRRRTTVIARTETAAALNVAADTFFEAAKDAANLPETALRRFWLITFDGRTCPICRAIPAMNEQGKLFQEPFMTSKGPYLRPPAHPQCRCVVIVRPTIIALPGTAVPPQAPAPTVLPAPVAFPTPPPKVKTPAKPKKPKAAPVPPAPQMSEQYTIATPSPPWATHPKQKFWEQIQDVDVGTLPSTPPGKLSTGVVMIEDGKVWVYEPKNHFGGYSTAFPKGTVEPHLTHQQNAIKEVFEETGLHAKVTGFVGDFTTTTGTTRLYLGHKIGGNPTGFGDETWSVKLLTPEHLQQALNAQSQPYPQQVFQTLQAKGLIAPPVPGAPPLPPVAPPGVPAVPPAPPVTAPAIPVVPPSTAPQAPTPPVKAKPLKATDKLELATAKGEFIRDLGGSTGAQQWRGTDGVERAVKKPQTQQAYQEFVANKLYRELGIDAPDQKLTMEQGKIAGVASTWEANTQTLERAGVTQARAREVLKGFVADVWLGNRDALGLTMDNILVKGDRVIRIDNGGALFYRAQGTVKPKEWTAQIGEWQGLQDPTRNRHYAGLFQAAGYGTAENIPDLKAQVQKLVDLRERTNGFADLVPAAPGITAKQRRDVVQLLQKRASLLEEQVGLKVAPGPDLAMRARTRAYLGQYEFDHLRQTYGTKAPTTMYDYEQVSITAYTGSYHKSMNKPFWTARDAATRAVERVEREPIIAPAMSGLPKLEPSKDGGTYYRGVDFIAPGHLATHVKDGEITLEGFASTSLSRQTAKNFGHSQYLYQIKGHGGSYDVRPLSQHAHEQEFLYPPDTKFRILDIVQEPDIAHPVYYVEEIPSMKKRESGRRGIVDKAELDDVMSQEAEPWPDPDGTWTHAQYVAHARAMQEADAAYIPTAEELAMGEQFMRKQESASGFNQVDPNAD